jgi:hypothetical protein
VNGTVSSSLGRSVLWQYPSALSMSSGKIQFYGFLSWVVDIGISLFLSIGESGVPSF